MRTITAGHDGVARSAYAGWHDGHTRCAVAAGLDDHTVGVEGTIQASGRPGEDDWRRG